MAKEVFHIHIAVLTDGVHPSKSSILNLTAKYDNFKFSQNILPALGVEPKATSFWKKHPTEFSALSTDAVSLKEAMDGFRTWLAKFPGRLVAVTSGVDFWHLMNAMMETGKDFPFGYHFLDVGTYVAASKKEDSIPTFVGPDAWEVIAAREGAYKSACELLSKGNGRYIEW